MIRPKEASLQSDRPFLTYRDRLVRTLRTQFSCGDLTISIFSIRRMNCPVLCRSRPSITLQVTLKRQASDLVTYDLNTITLVAASVSKCSKAARVQVDPNTIDIHGTGLATMEYIVSEMSVEFPFCPAERDVICHNFARHLIKATQR